MIRFICFPSNFGAREVWWAAERDGKKLRYSSFDIERLANKKISRKSDPADALTVACAVVVFKQSVAPHSPPHSLKAGKLSRVMKRNGWKSFSFSGREDVIL